MVSHDWLKCSRIPLTARQGSRQRISTHNIAGAKPGWWPKGSIGVDSRTYMRILRSARER